MISINFYYSSNWVVKNMKLEITQVLPSSTGVTIWKQWGIGQVSETGIIMSIKHNNVYKVIALGSVFCLAIKWPASCLRVPGFDSWLQLLTSTSCQCRAGKVVGEDLGNDLGHWIPTSCFWALALVSSPSLRPSVCGSSGEWANS